MTPSVKDLLVNAAKLIEEADLAEDDPVASDLLGKIHRVVTEEDEHYKDFDEWLEEVRQANYCNLMP